VWGKERFGFFPFTKITNIMKYACLCFAFLGQ